MMDAIRIATIFQNEIDVPQNIQTQYSEFIVPSIINNWAEVCTCHSLDNQQVLSAYFRYRLALGSTQIDHVPPELGDDLFLFSFLRGIFEEFLNNVSIRINVSPVILLWDHSRQFFNVLYASNNYFLFETAFQIHSEATKRAFFSHLSCLNLIEKMRETVNALSSKYEGAQIQLISLLFRSLYMHDIIYMLF